MTRTAVEIVRAYGVDAWTQGRDDLIPELCHDPIIRHDADREVRLSHAEQRARMRLNYEELRPVFEDVILAGDDEHVTLVWNVTGRDPNWRWCGIEVFRVVDGRIAEVWNSNYMDGRWGLSKSLTGRMGDGVPIALPLVGSDLVAAKGLVSGNLVVPADTSGMSWWLTQLLGTSTSERNGALWTHRFAPGGKMAPLSFEVRDRGGETIGLADVRVPALTVAWERSGLINATIPIEARSAEIAEWATAVAEVTRLAKIVGTFRREDVEGQVAEAAITLAADGSASGRVSLKFRDAVGATGAGRLSIGWREGERMLLFSGDAVLTKLSGAFADEGGEQAAFDWCGTGFTATLINDRAPLTGG